MGVAKIVETQFYIVLIENDASKHFLTIENKHFETFLRFCNFCTKITLSQELWIKNMSDIKNIKVRRILTITLAPTISGTL